MSLRVTFILRTGLAQETSTILKNVDSEEKSTHIRGST